MDEISGQGFEDRPRQPDSLTRIKASARKLFFERGYHATRPQDIARGAGLGNGTFYLHFHNKRDCFLAFVEDARVEFLMFMRARVGLGGSLETSVRSTLIALYELSDANPGLLCAAMTDEALIDVEGRRTSSLIQRWGSEWAKVIRGKIDNGGVSVSLDPEIAGQAIVGALHQCGLQNDRKGIPREVVIENLTRLLVRGLTP